MAHEFEAVQKSLSRWEVSIDGVHIPGVKSFTSHTAGEPETVTLTIVAHSRITPVTPSRETPPVITTKALEDFLRSQSHLYHVGTAEHTVLQSLADRVRTW